MNASSYGTISKSSKIALISYYLDLRDGNNVHGDFIALPELYLSLYLTEKMYNWAMDNSQKSVYMTKEMSLMKSNLHSTHVCQAASHIYMKHSKPANLLQNTRQ